MADKVETSHICKLDDSNYRQWKQQVSIVLEAKELWDIVSGDDPAPDPADAALLAAWRKKDARARATIVTLLDKNNSTNNGTSGMAKLVSSWHYLQGPYRPLT